MMSVLFFLLIDTRYAHPLGDYVFEFFGLNSWTGNQTGLHRSALFFRGLFLLTIRFVRKYAAEELNMGWIKIFFYLVGLNLIFSFVTGIIVKNIKTNSEGVLAIGIEQNSNLSYGFDKDRYTQFDADFTLKKLSDREQDFYLIIDDRHRIGGAQFYNLDGSEKLFNLKENEQKTFRLQSIM